jgi:hypothetical protein
MHASQEIEFSREQGDHRWWMVVVVTISIIGKEGTRQAGRMQGLSGLPGGDGLEGYRQALLKCYV